jgi:hypothetical protein
LTVQIRNHKESSETLQKWYIFHNSPYNVVIGTNAMGQSIFPETQLHYIQHPVYN